MRVTCTGTLLHVPRRNAPFAAPLRALGRRRAAHAAIAEAI